MLRILSSPKKLCLGMTRRDLLQVGGAGMFGLGLSRFLELRAQASETADDWYSAKFGKAKQCLLLYLWGAPSQIETFDMKPDAPRQIRGTMVPIPSTLPGADVCEYLPNVAKIMDRVTVVRSMSHPYPDHGVAFATTGLPTTNVALEMNPQDPRHHPFFASVVERLDRQQRNGGIGLVPQNVALPFKLSSQRPGGIRAGPYGAFLGSEYDPVWTEFIGEGTREVENVFGSAVLKTKDPYVGCTPESYIRVAEASAFEDLTIDRVNRRESLLKQLDGQRRELEKTQAARSFSRFQELAFSLISSPSVRDALDVRKEAASIRDMYGMTLFGQSCLAARRLLQAGTKLVTVFWDEYGLAGSAWDTHLNHFPRMQERLLPGFDMAFSGLILDLERRGMLDDTLVACISCHGRTPKLNDQPGGGRDHWSQAYSAVFAGGGISRGNVVGSTDKNAVAVANCPVSPKDVLATIYYLLGIDPHTRVHDKSGRPIPIVPDESRVVEEMFV